MWNHEFLGTPRIFNTVISNSHMSAILTSPSSTEQHCKVTVALKSTNFSSTSTEDGPNTNRAATTSTQCRTLKIMMHEWLYSSDTNDYCKCTDYTGDKFNLGKLYPIQVFDEYHYNGVEPQQRQEHTNLFQLQTSRIHGCFITQFY